MTLAGFGSHRPPDPMLYRYEPADDTRDGVVCDFLSVDPVGMVSRSKIEDNTHSSIISAILPICWE